MHMQEIRNESENKSVQLSQIHKRLKKKSARKSNVKLPSNPSLKRVSLRTAVWGVVGLE